MKRISVSLALCAIILGIGVSIAASRPGSDVPRISGKFVIIDVPGGLPVEVRDDVKFTSVQGHGFAVIPLTSDDGISYDYWVPANRIEGLKVFDSRDAAVAYHEKHAMWKKLRATRASAAQDPAPDSTSSPPAQ